MLKVTRIVIFILIIFISSLLGIFWCIIRPFHPDNIWHICQPLRYLGAKVLGQKIIIRGASKLDSSTPAVIIANHQNAFDLVPMARIFPRRTVSVGKRSLTYIPIFGQAYQLSGNIIIDRNKRQSALAALKKATKKILDKSISIWIFPEGTRSRKSGLLPFKKGGFHMAMNAKVPIIPISVSTFYKNINLNKWRSGTVIIDVLDPISTENYARSEASELANKCHKLMSEAISKADNELAST